MPATHDRRSFLKGLALVPFMPSGPRTRHLIFIVNGGGARKKDYYETPSIATNIRTIASEGYVFEEDHCEHVASHDVAFAEMMQGRRGKGSSPTITEYVRHAFGDDSSRYWHVGPGRSLDVIPGIMRKFKPRILIFHQDNHDAAHGSGRYQ